jgi:hypothetical protein
LLRRCCCKEETVPTCRGKGEEATQRKKLNARTVANSDIGRPAQNALLMAPKKGKPFYLNCSFICPINEEFLLLHNVIFGVFSGNGNL